MTPRNGTVHEIDPATFAVRRKIRVAPSAISMRLASDGQSLWILSREARALVQLELNRFQTGARVNLPAIKSRLAPRPMVSGTSIFRWCI